MISFIAPALNEARFAKAWAKCVTKYSDDCIVMDTGSTDDTIDILKAEGVKVHRWPGGVRPYDWPEGKIRNRLIQLARYPWICILDMDELLGPEFDRGAVSLTRESRGFIRFKHLDFWYSPQLTKAKELKRNQWRRFETYQIRMFRKSPVIGYKDTGNHAYLQYCGLGKFSLRLTRKTCADIPFYHYHHVIWGKSNENRYEESRRNGLRLKLYTGPHPEETKYYDWWDARTLAIPNGPAVGLSKIRSGGHDCVSDF